MRPYTPIQKLDEPTWEFLKILRDESLHHKDKRATFVLQKLVVVAALFSLGSGTIGGIDLSTVLFIVPFVALAMDIFISAEDYKVKRIGTFFRIYRYTTPAERNWERFVNQHREEQAVRASLALTVIAFLASLIAVVSQIFEGMPASVSWLGYVLWIFRMLSWIDFVFVWAVIVVFLIRFVFRYYDQLNKTLPKPHLAEHHERDLLNAAVDPGDRLIIALLLSTGITCAELVNLQYVDISDSRYVIVRGDNCEARQVPHRLATKFDEIRIQWLSQPENIGLSAERLVFHQSGNPNAPILPEDIEKILERYKIVIDGTIRSVPADELRRTYARRSYEADPKLSLTELQARLGCQDIADVLGYIGPIEVLREQRSEADELHYVMCVANQGRTAVLQLCKLYRVVPDREVPEGELRVIDESGQSHLYPAELFARVVFSGDDEQKLQNIFPAT